MTNTLDAQSPGAGEHPPVVPFGVDDHGDVVVWEVGHRQAHTVIVGRAGTGKTETIRAILDGALRDGAQAVVIDSARKEYLAFRGRSGVGAVVSTVEDCAALIEAMTAEMHRRHARLYAGRHDDLTPVLIVVDELQTLQERLHGWWHQMPDDERRGRYGTDTARCPHLAMLTTLVKLGGAVEIHLLLGTQRPAYLGVRMRENITHRVTLGRVSPQASWLLWGDAETGNAHGAEVGEGISNAGGRAPRRIRVQVAARPAHKQLHEHPAGRSRTQPGPLLNLGNISAAARRLRPNDCAHPADVTSGAPEQAR